MYARGLLLIFLSACASPGVSGSDAGCIRGACDGGPPPCFRNADCARGLACDPVSRACVPDRGPCADRSDCLADQVCRDGRCMLPIDPDGAVTDPDVHQPLDMKPDLPTRDAGFAPMPDAQPELDAALADIAHPPPIDALSADGPPDVELRDLAPLADAEPDITRPAPDVLVPDATFPDAALPDAAVPDAAPDAQPPAPGPPPRGDYRYTRLPVGGLVELARVAFHPSGDFALALSTRGAVLVVDWADLTATPFTLPAGEPVYWTDVAFLPDGSAAVLTGYRFGDMDTGFVADFDTAAYRADEPPLTEIIATRRPDERATAVSISPEGDPTVLLRRRVGGGYNAILRGYDPAAQSWTALLAATVTSAGCGALAHVHDEFGGVAHLITCGENGADLHLYRTLGGVAEWVPRPGVGNIGNLGGVAAHPSLDYALIIGWSGRRVHRFEGGRLLPSNTAPNYARLGISNVAFQPNGRRALIVGRAGVQPVRGTVIEFRHDLYRCPNVAGDCDLTEVSIPDFDQPPYNADGNHRLNDAAFHPLCDAGLLVGGYTAFRQDIGLLIRFDIDGGRPCE